MSNKGIHSFHHPRYLPLALMLITTIPLVGCAEQKYQRLRRDGQTAMLAGKYYPAREYFQECDFLAPRNVENLHDMGTCSLFLARQKFERDEHAAALREVDRAISYFSQALEVHPGHQPSLRGKNIALELKGQFDEALKHAEWAAEFVGPAAKQYIFLANEREERGDDDGALLAYKQAVAIEPKNADAHVAYAKFLLKHDHEKEAVQHLQVAYRLDPTDGWVIDQLAQRSALPTLIPAKRPAGSQK